MITTNELALIASIIALVVSLYSLMVARISQERSRAEFWAVQNAPILRQYVEKFVPIDNSKEAIKTKEAAMAKAQREFNKAYGLEDLDNPNPIFTRDKHGADKSSEINVEDTV